MFNLASNFKKIVKRHLLPVTAACACILAPLSSLADVPAMTVSGNKVLVGGKETSLAGMSLFWGNNGWGGEKYYNAAAVAYLKNDWKASIVRAAMGVEDGGGYFSNPGDMEQKVRTVVNAAIANDMYVIIDWHSHRAVEHDWSHSVEFFKKMAREYGQYNNVIYEVYNEPLDYPWNDIKAYAETVINAIRSIDPDNLIVVGTPRWSQGVVDASHNPIQANNIAYTLHFYAGTHHQWLRDQAQQALNSGIPLFVTEWGTVNADGNGGVNEGETAAWMTFLKNNSIHHANWSLNDKAEGASALNPGANPNGGWGDGELTWSGHVVRNYLRNWSQVPPVNECNRIAIPGVMQGESYCWMSGVDLENTTDAGGGLNVGWIDAGDWMSYLVNVTQAGNYQVSYRVASLNGGGYLQIERAGGDVVYGGVNIPYTGGWQNWTTVTNTIYLNAGEQGIGLAVPSGGFNINWISFTRLN